MGLAPQPWGGQREGCPGPGPVPGVRPERAQRQRAIERGGMCAPRSQHPEQDSAHPSDRQTDRRRAPTHRSRSGSGPVPPRGVERATKRNCRLCSGFSRFPTNDPTPSRDETPGPHRAATAPRRGASPTAWTPPVSRLHCVPESPSLAGSTRQSWRFSLRSLRLSHAQNPVACGRTRVLRPPALRLCLSSLL